MSYSNFKQTFWSKHIQRELEKLCVLQEDCDYQFEGEAKHGEKVKILGVSRPTISTYTGASIGDPETVDDSSMFLEIDQAKYFNFMVDDIDKAQSKEGLMEKLTEEASAGLAEARDSYIASLSTGAGTFSSSTAVSTPEQAKELIDDAFVKLWNNGVKISAKTSIVIPPWFYNIFKNNLIEISTDNTSLIKNGVVGRYNGATVKISDNLYFDGTDFYIMVRTNKAVAFASQIEKTEAYRPHGLFADALKGLDVYGAKVVRPKEMYVIKARKG